MIKNIAAKARKGVKVYMINDQELYKLVDTLIDKVNELESTNDSVGVVSRLESKISELENKLKSLEDKLKAKESTKFFNKKNKNTNNNK